MPTATPKPDAANKAAVSGRGKEATSGEKLRNSVSKKKLFFYNQG
jgi:hypothetical protein